MQLGRHKRPHTGPVREVVPAPVDQSAQPRRGAPPFQPRGGRYHSEGSRGVRKPVGHHRPPIARSHQQCDQKPLELDSESPPQGGVELRAEAEDVWRKCGGGGAGGVAECIVIRTEPVTEPVKASVQWFSGSTVVQPVQPGWHEEGGGADEERGEIEGSDKYHTVDDCGGGEQEESRSNWIGQWLEKGMNEARNVFGKGKEGELEAEEGGVRAKTSEVVIGEGEIEYVGSGGVIMTVEAGGGRVGVEDGCGHYWQGEGFTVLGGKGHLWAEPRLMRPAETVVLRQTECQIKEPTLPPREGRDKKQHKLMVDRELPPIDQILCTPICDQYKGAEESRLSFDTEERHEHNKRYWETYNEIEEYSEELEVGSYKLGLTLRERLWENLTLNPLIDLWDLMSRVEMFARLEDNIKQAEKVMGTTTHVKANLKEREKTELIQFLKANIEVSVWTPYEMPRIDPNFIKHELNVLFDARLVKQKGRRSSAEHMDAVIEKVEKLKEADAIIERMVTKMFESILGKTMDTYIDDMVMKSKEELDHIRDLTEVFRILKKHKLRLNTAKCAFGVSSGNFLEHLVTRRGIEVNLEQ
ncbi:hypothetical protein Acr_00g0029250 [Actinidia rufa]|uniref:Reverse transcriptase domain-containing protein n=1 Tax=Actinidia rufa TaxID=165716 RepID=A0A7J0DGE0_9ERIC|nr:hypothetical protein Acr_00g0029250 [Actinidia rufa]